MTLSLVALILAAPVLGFSAVNIVDRRGWESQIATDCLQPGEARACVGVLRVPSLGADWARPIIDERQAQPGDTGVTWVSGTTAPGDIGNFVVAGRRLGGGQPGAEIIVETPSHVYTYVIDVAPKTLTTNEFDSWVLDPVPGNPAVVPQQALLTVIVRQDLWPTRDRSVGVAVLRHTVEK